MGTSAAANGQDQQIEVRAVTEDELPVWDRAIARGFLRPHVGDGTEYRKLIFEPGRMLAAFDHTDGGRAVATFRSFDQELTVPGGATLPVDAITAVTVNSTHRRRGLLSRMMRHDLVAARERGSAAAILIAAEYNIYGRFGFGPATRANGWRIDVQRSGGLRPDLPVPDGGRIDFVTLEEIRKIGPDLHERWRLTQPGAIGPRADYWWKLNTGEVTLPGYDWKEPFVAVHRDAGGTATGLVGYTVDDDWDGSYPNCTLTVTEFLALDRPTANALLRLVFSVDWVRRITIANRGVDDPLPLLLNDPRGAVPHEENADFMWLRLLDVPAAFGARRYAAPGRVVLEVTDPEGYAAGRWALEADADGTGRCTPTGEEPDLALGAPQFASLYLGTETASRLAAAALLREIRPGAAAAADLMLRMPIQPWNPDGF
ncbi:GNAT family N-acetyltransferase [Kitasatospora camelliae]|uniref:GNAT family N-acetyltransferase n=1 Tax=Kitasatospora camelliae TaxID=3156397 RepID=A0AAU8JZ03_9ACTN